ncbi:MAG TPA: chemotaxis response regulator protein-glutamate methylesterase [Aromatoleum sp.]|uniref:protein-glutamate methylesterase/protein-glutamine glutaminase n=1 Tax=Aromatoleum sp. TaxID=2307007 RepID=UPI002B47B28C|nr:chemotaxis response regulator protein-glutamate methylesterase [Aromatoleum sp.]HJV26258.1 chemotaxis response regulator protein-glutamate methylesterase [Aromatoleum sp.]
MSPSQHAPPSILVMVIDGSAVVRQGLANVIARAPGMELIATASSPQFALNKLRRRWPDVIILDIDMPGSDCLSFLRRIMSEHPTAVIGYSSLVEHGKPVGIKALDAGAFSVIAKPRSGLKDFIVAAADDIVAEIRVAARADPRRLKPTFSAPEPKFSADAVISAMTSTASQPASDKVIALGTSTGGTQALEAVLTRLPANVAGIVVVQHMPERFTALFAERLNELCAVTVREARHNDRVLPGHALIAPGGRHMVLKRCGMQYHVDVIDGPPVNRHKPSVDVLFRSVAHSAGRNALGVIMTGMGDDGACGLSDMRRAGAATIAQDEASSVVFGMPKEAIRLGAAESVLPLDRIPAALVGFSSDGTR